MPEGTMHSDQAGRQKGEPRRLIGATKGGMNSMPHTIYDSHGRLLDLFVTLGKVNGIHWLCCIEAQFAQGGLAAGRSWE